MDGLTPRERSEIMARVRSKGPEFIRLTGVEPFERQLSMSRNPAGLVFDQ